MLLLYGPTLGIPQVVVARNQARKKVLALFCEVASVSLG
jgi:hypothetical protein